MASASGAYLSHSAFGTVYSAATLASALMLSWIGRRIDDVDLRLYIAAVTVGLAVAAVAMAVAPGAGVLWLALFGLRFCGQGLMAHAAVTSMGRYFSDQRGKAMSFAGLGMPLGEALFPLAAVLAMSAVGWRQTWFMAAAVLALGFLPLLPWLLKGQGARHLELAEKSGRAGAAADAASRQWSRGEVLGDFRFYLVLPAVVMPAFVLTGMFFHQAVLAQSKGWPLAWLATAFTGYAAFHIAGSVVAGALVDCLSARRLLPFYQLPLALGLMALGLSGDPWVAFFYLCFAAMTTGASLPVVNAMWAEVYGVRHLGAIKAMTSSLMVLATALSPIAFGAMLDGGIGFDAIALMAAAGAMLAAVLMAVRVRIA